MASVIARVWNARRRPIGPPRLKVLEQSSCLAVAAGAARLPDHRSRRISRSHRSRCRRATAATEPPELPDPPSYPSCRPTSHRAARRRCHHCRPFHHRFRQSSHRHAVTRHCRRLSTQTVPTRRPSHQSARPRRRFPRTESRRSHPGHQRYRATVFLLTSYPTTIHALTPTSLPCSRRDPCRRRSSHDSGSGPPWHYPPAYFDCDRPCTAEQSAVSGRMKSGNACAKE